MSRRRDAFRDSDSKRETDFKAEITSRISTAEISSLSIQNFDDSSKPLIYKFKINVPNYAQKAGRRLIVQPGFFEHGARPVFSAEKREHNIHFPYPWSEKDEVQIQLPKGFELENADAPQDVADPKKIGSLKINMSIDRATNLLLYKRDFHFGGGGHTLFPAAVYTPMKGLFDAFHKADTHAIALRQATK